MKTLMRHAVLLLALAARWASAQQLGFKLLGGAGIDAGIQVLPGVTVISQAIHYGATQLRDRQGNVAPVEGVSISGTGSSLGVSYTTKPKQAPYLSFAFAVPVANVHVNSDRPAVSRNGLGFADLFLQPIKVGWRRRRFDVVSSYVLYVPTGRYELRGVGPGRGYWTNQLSVGGALYADSTRGRRMSALASYEVNTRRRGLDFRRGNMFQVQGGAGATVKRVMTLGVAGYALWQTTPDRGADIPVTLRDERARVFGLGPEVNVIIPRWQTRAALRIERDFGVRSRPKGQVIAFSLFWRAWPAN